MSSHSGFIHEHPVSPSLGVVKESPIWGSEKDSWSLRTPNKKIMSVTRTNWRDDDINQRIEVTSLDLVLLPGGDTQGVK